MRCYIPFHVVYGGYTSSVSLRNPPSPQGEGQLTDKGVQDESSEPFVVLYKGFEIWYNIGVKRVLEEQVCLRKEAESKINLRW